MTGRLIAALLAALMTLLLLTPALAEDVQKNT